MSPKATKDQVHAVCDDTTIIWIVSQHQLALKILCYCWSISATEALLLLEGEMFNIWYLSFSHILTLQQSPIRSQISIRTKVRISCLWITFENEILKTQLITLHSSLASEEQPRFLKRRKQHSFFHVTQSYCKFPCCKSSLISTVHATLAKCRSVSFQEMPTKFHSIQCTMLEISVHRGEDHISIFPIPPTRYLAYIKTLFHPV